VSFQSLVTSRGMARGRTALGLRGLEPAPSTFGLFRGPPDEGFGLLAKPLHFFCVFSGEQYYFAKNGSIVRLLI
jgi:hypothetical protein